MRWRELYLASSRCMHYERLLAGRSQQAKRQFMVLSRRGSFLMLLFLAAFALIFLVPAESSEQSGRSSQHVMSVLFFAMIVLSRSIIGCDPLEAMLVPRQAILIARWRWHALPLAIFSSLLVLCVALRDFKFAPAAFGIDLYGTFALALVLPTIDAMAGWITLERRAAGGGARLFLASAGLIFVSLWVGFLGYLSHTGFPDGTQEHLVAETWLTWLLLALLLLLPATPFIAPAVRRTFLTHAGVRSLRELLIVALLFLISLPALSTLFVAIFLPGEKIVGRTSDGAMLLDWPIFIALSLIAYLLLLLRQWVLCDRVDLAGDAGTPDLMPLLASEQRPLPEHAGGGMLRAGLVFLLARIDVRDSNLLSRISLCLWEVRAPVLGFLWAFALTLVIKAMQRGQSALAFMVASVMALLLITAPSPLGIRASRRLHFLGAAYKDQARHNIAWGIAMGVFPALAGVILGTFWLSAFQDGTVWQCTAILIAAAYLIAHMSAAPGGRIWDYPAHDPRLPFFAIGLCCLPLLGQPAALSFSAVAFLATLWLAKNRWSHADWHAAWELRAADDV